MLWHLRSARVKTLRSAYQISDEHYASNSIHLKEKDDDFRREIYAIEWG